MLKYFPFVANCSLFVSFIFALQAKKKKKRERERKLADYTLWARICKVYLRDLETCLSNVGVSLVWFLECPKRLLLPKFHILSNCELQLKSL